MVHTVHFRRIASAWVLFGRDALGIIWSGPAARVKEGVRYLRCWICSPTLFPPGGPSCRFENRLPGPNDLIKFNPKLLKALVQKWGRPREKFENRLLGPTNFFKQFYRAPVFF